LTNGFWPDFVGDFWLGFADASWLGLEDGCWLGLEEGVWLCLADGSGLGLEDCCGFWLIFHIWDAFSIYNCNSSHIGEMQRQRYSAIGNSLTVQLFLQCRLRMKHLVTSLQMLMMMPMGMLLIMGAVHQKSTRSVQNTRNLAEAIS